MESREKIYTRVVMVIVLIAILAIGFYFSPWNI